MTVCTGLLQNSIRLKSEGVFSTNTSEKQNNILSCTNSRRKTFIFVICKLSCHWHKRGIFFIKGKYKLVKIVEKLVFGRLKNFSSKRCSTTTRFFKLSPYPTTSESSFLNIISLWSVFSDQLSSNLKNVSLMDEAIFHYSEQEESTSDPRNLATYSILRPLVYLVSNCSKTFEKMVSFNRKVCFIVEKNIVSFASFGCGLTLHIEVSTNLLLFHWQRTNVSASCDSRVHFPTKVQYDYFFIQELVSKIFGHAYKLHDMVWPTHLTPNHTPFRDPMTIEYPQPTTWQPKTDIFPPLSPLRPTDTTRNGLRVSFAFYHRFFYCTEKKEWSSF